LYKAVVFDIDGTLIDSVDLHAMAWQEALRNWGYEITFEDVRRQVGKGGDQLMPVFVPANDLERHGEEISEYRSQLFKRKYLPMVKPFSAVPELLRRISDEGLKIALASSAKGDELDAYKKLAGVADLVQDETSKDDVHRSKPFPDVFSAALEKLGDVDPEDAVAVGDTPYDAEAAGKLGLPIIGMLSGGWTEDELRKAGCFAVYRGPADLLGHFEESPLAVRARKAA